MNVSHTQSGVAAPCRSTIQNRRIAVLGMSQACYKALQNLQELARSDKTVHMESLTWKMLSAREFIELHDDAKTGFQQAYLVEHMARCGVFVLAFLV